MDYAYGTSFIINRTRMTMRKCYDGMSKGKMVITCTYMTLINLFLICLLILNSCNTDDKRAFFQNMKESGLDVAGDFVYKP